MKNARRSSVSLSLEQLEDRLVPATVTFIHSTLSIVGDNNSEGIRVTQANGRIAINGTTLNLNAGSVKSVVVDARGGNDVVDLRGLHINATVNGNSGHDIIYGGSGNDVLRGGSGEDRLFGMGGNDYLYGEANDDRLMGGDGYDYLIGGTGMDFMDDGDRFRHEYYVHDNDQSVDYIADMLAPASGASASHIDQNTGSYTCAFLAAIASMAHNGISPHNYVEFVKTDDEGVGHYDVKLHNGRQLIRIRVQFEGHIRSDDCEQTADYASWAIIMNRAWVKLHGNQGATGEQVMHALNLRSMVSRTMNLDTFSEIARATARGNLVVSGTVPNAGRGLEGGHAYTVLWAGFINGKRMVQVRNPWGVDWIENRKVVGDANPHDGILMLTWEQFAGNMRTVTIGGK